MAANCQATGRIPMMEAQAENVRAAWEWVVQCGQEALLGRTTGRLIDRMASYMERRTGRC